MAYCSAVSVGFTNWAGQASAIDARHSFYAQGILQLCFMKGMDVVKCSLKSSDSFCGQLWVWEILQHEGAQLQTASGRVRGVLDNKAHNVTNNLCDLTSIGAQTISSFTRSNLSVNCFTAASPLCLTASTMG